MTNSCDFFLAEIITCASYHAERQDFPLYFQNNSAELGQLPSIWCQLHALIITLPLIWLVAACLRSLGTLSVSCSCPFSCYAFFTPPSVSLLYHYI